MLRLIHRHPPRIVSGILLLALLLRAMIPVGFMPAARAFSLEICRDGFLQTGGPERHGHSRLEACPFGSAPAAAPITQILPPAAPAPSASRLLFPDETSAETGRLANPYQARGPPSALS